MALFRLAALALAAMALIVPPNAKANCLRPLSEFNHSCFFRDKHSPTQVSSVNSFCKVKKEIWPALSGDPSDSFTTYTLSWRGGDRITYSTFGGPGRSGRGVADASYLSSPIRWELHGETIVFFHENGDIAAIRWNPSASGNTAEVPVPPHIERPGGVYSGGAYYVNGYRFAPKLETP